jgi:hypothetical protein
MFCPLCKAEYRPGFITCSDCQIGLVETQGEAKAVKTEQLVLRDREALGTFLDCLADESIPYRTRGVLRSSPWPWISLLFWRFMRPRPVSEFCIDIFEKDAERAREALARITGLQPSD